MGDQDVAALGEVERGGATPEAARLAPVGCARVAHMGVPGAAEHALEALGEVRCPGVAGALGALADGEVVDPCSRVGGISAVRGGELAPGRVHRDDAAALVEDRGVGGDGVQRRDQATEGRPRGDREAGLRDGGGP